MQKLTAEYALRTAAAQQDDGITVIQTELDREGCIALAEEITLLADDADYRDEVTDEGGWVDVWGDADICGEFRIHLVPAR